MAKPCRIPFTKIVTTGGIYGFYGGGQGPLGQNVIQYINTTLLVGNSIASGILSEPRWHLAGVYGSIYGFFGGGVYVSGLGQNKIDYINLTLTSGNANNKGILTHRRIGLAGVSGFNYGFFGGGYYVQSGIPIVVRTIDYINLTTTIGNAINRGLLTQKRVGLAGVSGNIYGFFGGGGDDIIEYNIIDYIILANTSGNALDRGDITVKRYYLAGVSGDIYGFYGGGEQLLPPYYKNVIDYINITITSGNAIDRGDLTIARQELAGTSGVIYGFYGGGYSGFPLSNVIDYINMSIISGNAIDRGDLFTPTIQLAGVGS